MISPLTKKDKKEKNAKRKEEDWPWHILYSFFINSACQPFVLVISMYESCGKKNVGHAYVCEVVNFEDFLCSCTWALSVIFCILDITDYSTNIILISNADSE